MTIGAANAKQLTQKIARQPRYLETARKMATWRQEHRTMDDNDSWNTYCTRKEQCTEQKSEYSETCQSD
jgi:hypothetical protein